MRNKKSAAISTADCKLSKIFKVKGRFLVNTVVEPVGEHKVCMTSPGEHGRLGWVVVGKIIVGEVDLVALVKVTEILVCKGQAVVFRMTCDEELSAVLFCNNMYPRHIRRSEYFQHGNSLDVKAANLGVTGMWNIEYLVKAL